jgi:hypothetical protein
LTLNIELLTCLNIVSESIFNSKNNGSIRFSITFFVFEIFDFEHFEFFNVLNRICTTSGSNFEKCYRA